METITATKPRKNRKKRGKGRGSLVQDILPVTLAVSKHQGDEKTTPASKSANIGTPVRKSSYAGAVIQDPEELLPVGIAYGVRKAAAGTACPDDLRVLQGVATTYGCTIREFILLHRQNQRELDELLVSAASQIRSADRAGTKKAHLALIEAISLMSEFSFLGTPANISALDALALEAGLPWMRLKEWRNNMRTAYGVKFRTITGIRDYTGGAEKVS
jgi:hypothetical protein